MRSSKLTKPISVVAAVAIIAAGCTTLDPYTGETKRSQAAKGATIGAIIGAVAGAATNTSDGEQTLKNAALGALAGAAIGGAIGNYQDRQEAELRRELEATGVRINRVGDTIELIMPSNITFDVDQADIKSNFYPTLNSVTTVLAKYDQTGILIAGHTDSTGSDQYNSELSVHRAESVGNYLAAQGVAVPRIQALGYGESEPIADNSSEYGRAQNRRVEIQIVPLEGGNYQ